MDAPADEPYLRDTDLTEQQRSWRLEDGDDLFHGVLPWKVEVWPMVMPDGSRTPPAYQLKSFGDPPWDWRTVSFWRHALPETWQVWLMTPYRVALVPPAGRRRGEGGAAAAWVTRLQEG